MANFLRMLAGLLLLPTCWGVTRAFVDVLVIASESAGGSGFAGLALVGGLAAFTVCWMSLPHPVKTYVFGHELTHALWGLFFGARPSNLRVGASGGSVKLTKTNVFITLAPYFFPFYTFIVSVVAFLVWLFAGRLPWLPLWMFLIGFTWAFHVLFTIETLAQRQPDVKLYGRIFSWTFIYCANVLLVLLWMTAMTPLTGGQMVDSLLARTWSAYAGVGHAVASAWSWTWGIVS